MRKIKITGYMYVDPEEVDEGNDGPLTEDAFNEVMSTLELDDVVMELVEE